MTYRPSETLSLAIISRPGKPSKKQFSAGALYDADTKRTEQALAVIPKTTPHTWNVGEDVLIVKDVWIGWTRDGWKTTITDEDLRERHGFSLYADLPLEPA